MAGTNAYTDNSTTWQDVTRSTNVWWQAQAPTYAGTNLWDAVLRQQQEYNDYQNMLNYYWCPEPAREPPLPDYMKVSEGL